jgi:hypothetical protein
VVVALRRDGRAVVVVAEGHEDLGEHVGMADATPDGDLTHLAVEDLSDTAVAVLAAFDATTDTHANVGTNCVALGVGALAVDQQLTTGSSRENAERQGLAGLLVVASSSAIA